MKRSDIAQALRLLKKAAREFRTPYVSEEAGTSRDPFRVLVSCILSLRTRDETTAAASKRLFAIAPDPPSLADLDTAAIERAVYPVGFYRSKAATLKEIARRIVDEFGGAVPDTIEGLLELRGVGRKTANLVVTMGFGKPGICVDTHVHRITNRWGLVSTPTPEKTEFALRELLPRRYWIEINDLLVAYGQNVCTPLSPWCSRCVVAHLCDAVGVARRR
ncbi:MAG TPA: endonuclease III [Deltaproteobacteria bacterium]|nr:endonuclease III [Deltaproteobacteria bacterium]